jgi:hypothetical protein
VPPPRLRSCFARAPAVRARARLTGSTPRASG